MSLSTPASNDLLKLLLQALPFAGIASNAAASPLTVLWVSLHTADPGAAGLQNASEVAYPGYARVAVARDATGWSVLDNEATPLAPIDFPEAGGAASALFLGIGVAPAGASKLMARGALASTLAITTGMTPRIGTATKIRFEVGAATIIPTPPSDIVAFGDSLTGGTGGTTSYGVKAAAMFPTARSVSVQGIGGQSSTQIATRQGGRTLTVSLGGAPGIPAAQSVSFDYAAGATADGWGGYGGGSASVADGKLKVSGPSYAGIFRDFTPNLQVGSKVTGRVTFTSMQRPVSVLGLNTGFGQGTNYPTVQAPAPGAFDFELVPFQQVAAFCMLLGGEVTGPGSIFEISSLNYLVTGAVAVPTKNTNILYEAGNFQNSASGTLAGVRGTMNTDSSGNWSFARSETGALVAVPDNTQFVLDSAVDHRNKTHWIWAGTNNAPDTAAVLADIAAMVAYLPHTRFLVLSLPGFATDAIGSTQRNAIYAINTALAATYGERYLDVRSLLVLQGTVEEQALDIVPASLRVDSIHLNDAGYSLIATAATNATLARGW